MEAEKKNKSELSIIDVPIQSELIGYEKQSDTRIVRKNNAEIGYKVRSGHLSLLSRKIYSIFIWYAQDMRGQEDTDGRWCVPVANLVKDANMHSKDYDTLRACLDELQTARVVRHHLSGGITSEVLIPSYTLDNISHEGNEGRERGQKKRGGQLMLWFMFPPELKKHLLDPDQYTRLRIAYMVLMRTTPGYVLYEACSRYKNNPGKITNRDSWQNWWRVLTGNADDADPPEYKYVKRDIFKRACTEVNQITDIEVALIEHLVGKSVRDIQFSVKPKQQTNLDIGPSVIETGLLSSIVSLGISVPEAERLIALHSEAEIADTLKLIQIRAEKSHLPKLESMAAYFRTGLKGRYAKSQQLIESDKAKKIEEQKERQSAKLLAEEEGRAQKQKTHQEIMEKFESLPEEEKAELLEKFKETLAPQQRIVFNRTGINGKPLRATFAGWLLQNRPSL